MANNPQWDDVEFVEFDQDDADDYHLTVWSDNGPDPDGTLRLHFTTSQAVALFEMLEKDMGRYIGEMRAAEASFKRGDGPNGEPSGTWEADRDDGYESGSPKRSDYLEHADALRDSARGK